MLNLFYEEPEGDRWLPFDRYPRRVIRRIVRGKPRPGGQTRVFLNLRAGLDRIGVPYRVNDYRHARKNPHELACIVGKPCVLDKIKWKNPILFGAAVYSHPLDDPQLLERLPIKRILVPGPWMRDMCKPYWGDAVEAWPVGVDTELWRPSEAAEKSADVLLYDKVRWEHDRYEAILIEPIRAMLRRYGCSFREMRYGHYREKEFHTALDQCRAMIFLCEHETQGIAYQQALSCGVPIFAWDRGGYWRDPSYYPDKVKFGPVTSVPYWDERCGERFIDTADFAEKWQGFWEGAKAGHFKPRDYIVENLTLEKCARDYVEIIRKLESASESNSIHFAAARHCMR
jgi:glycosyltransferase involved in cell wall biosynthesis